MPAPTSADEQPDAERRRRCGTAPRTCTSASHDCATHLVPGAVYENTSWCGMPWSRMYSPVRRCQKNELSDSLRDAGRPAEHAEERGEHPPEARSRARGAGVAGATGVRRARPRPAASRVGVAVIVRARREMLIIAGPRMTTKIDGKMQNTSGNSILTGAFCAFSCAMRRRLMRISSACERRSREIDTPKVSACSMARMKRPQLGHVGALGHGPQRVGPGRADAGLVQHAAELVGQRRRAPRCRCGRAPARSRGRPRPRSRAGRGCRAACARSPSGGPRSCG